MEDYLNEQENIDVIGVAYDGRECINLLDNVEPDILILDIIMPHVDGLAVLQHIKDKNEKNSPNIIMLTAFGQEEVMRKAVEYGASYFILKPFDFENLVNKIREIYNQNNHQQVKITHTSRQK